VELSDANIGKKTSNLSMYWRSDWYIHWRITIQVVDRQLFTSSHCDNSYLILWDNCSFALEQIMILQEIINKLLDSAVFEAGYIALMNMSAEEIARDIRSFHSELSEIPESEIVVCVLDYQKWYKQDRKWD